MLGERNGVFLGASKISLIVQNVDNVSKGPLPVEVVQKIDSLWEKTVLILYSLLKHLYL
jgi:hypothetical protein